MFKQIDAVFVNANNSQEVYQDLSKNYSAIETPIWAALLAKHCLSKGFNVEILDCEALNLTEKQSLDHIKYLNPRLICFVVYGQQPSASAQNMQGAVNLSLAIKQEIPDSKILFVGGYPSALPSETLLDNRSIDFVCQNEGVYTISELLKTDLKDVDNVPGLGFIYKNTNYVAFNKKAMLVRDVDLEKDLPGMAWHLLPLDKYRTSLWHALSNKTQRQPFASLYTSLGCPFACTFCCINSPFEKSSFRFWKPDFIIKEFDFLAKSGIKNVKIADEMFVLNENHFLRLCNLIIEQEYKFNIWAYARIDTVKERYLETLKKAGVNWLALGIESANQTVRKNVIKGRFDDIDIRSVVKKIRDHGINVIGNYIFGLPYDNHETMQETLNLALELNTEAVNFYSAMAYPGSKLYTESKEKGLILPITYSGFSQHSYDCQPLSTNFLSAQEVLKFRDEAWLKYHTNPNFLNLIKIKFGEEAYNETIKSTKIKLRRKLLGDEKIERESQESIRV